VNQLAQFFSNEKLLYQDIAQDRADKHTQVAIALVQGKSVISSALVDRVLSAYDLKWPAQKPFQDERLIAGICELIKARSVKRAQLSQDAADRLAELLKSLAAAHNELRETKAVTLGELYEESEVVKKLLAAADAASGKRVIPTLQALDQLPVEESEQEEKQ
jgi:hypothetical protein